jgi:adenosylhomocysteine nucleosidase
MTTKKTILGLVAALPGEARSVLGIRRWRRSDGWKVRHQTVDNGLDLVCVRSGMGAENAYGAARWLARHGVTALAAMGISGGLNPDLKPGDIVVPELIMEYGNGRPHKRWMTDSDFVHRFHAISNRLGLAVYRGAILSTEKPVLTTPGKTALYTTTGAQAVDMESAAVARAAAEAGLAVVVLRAICDRATDDVSQAQFNLLDTDGTIRWPFLAVTLLHRPDRISGLIGRGRQYAKGLSALKRGWRLQVKHRINCAR